MSCHIITVIGDLDLIKSSYCLSLTFNILNERAALKNCWNYTSFDGAMDSLFLFSLLTQGTPVMAGEGGVN